MSILRNISLLCTSVMTGIASFAQTIQPGQTLEYNEKNTKTPLGGVEIVIRDAGSTVSDAKGNFTLTFNTLQPGDKVVYRQIQKSGFEIFNKQALEQWYISKDKKPFQIVLCRTEKFKALTENYQRVSSDSYARQYKKDQDALAAQLKEGKLKEEEYKKQLLALEDKYYEDLQNLDNYVDMFARIDLSELSNREQKIIEMLQAGNVDEAIKAYEDQNYLEKFKQEAADKVEIVAARKKLEDLESQKNQAMESIMASIERQISAYQLAGGKDNYVKIGTILHEVASADTTNLDIVNRYAKFSHEQNNYDEAYRYYLICTHGYKKEKLAATYINLGSLCRSMNKYDDCEKYLHKAISLYSEIQDTQVTCKSNHAKAENELGNLYLQMGKYPDAETHFRIGYEILQGLIQDGNQEFLSDMSGVLNNLGLLYMRMKNTKEAEKNIKKAIETYQQLSEDNPDMYERYLAMAQGNLGVLYFHSGRYEETETYWNSAIHHYQSLYKKNPDAYAFDLAKSEYNLGRYYKTFNRYEEAKTEYLNALEIFNLLYSKNNSVYAVYVAEAKNSLSYVFAHQGKFLEAILSVDEAISLVPNEPNYLDTKGDILMMVGNKDAAMEVSQKIKEIDPDFFKKNSSDWYKKL